MRVSRNHGTDSRTLYVSKNISLTTPISHHSMSHTSVFFYCCRYLAGQWQRSAAEGELELQCLAPSKLFPSVLYRVNAASSLESTGEPHLQDTQQGLSEYPDHFQEKI